MSASFRRRGTGSGRSSSNSNKQGPSAAIEENVGIKSFRRYIGCKPWTGGYTLTSTGLREWDQMICNGGGGQPLRTCMVVEEDRWTCDLALSLTRYWAAEAISQDQVLMLVAMREDEPLLEGDTFLDDTDESKESFHDDTIGGLTPLDLQEFVNHRIPLNLHWEKEERRRKQQQQQQQQHDETAVEAIRTQNISTTAILEEADNEDEDYDEEDDNIIRQEGEEGLINAWQYKLSIQQQRLGLKQVAGLSSNNNGSNSSSNQQQTTTSSVYCHSYDLSANMKTQQHTLIQHKHIRIANCAVNTRSVPIVAAIQFYRSCLRHIQQELQTTQQNNGNNVIRVLISNGIVSILSIALPLLLSFIRQHDLPVVILVTIRPWLLPSSSNRHLLHRAADAVLSCQSFASNTSTVPSEFANLMGLLYVPKMSFLLPSASTTATFLQANRFGLKRNRRKMEICMLHLPPEEFSNNGTGSVSGGGGLRSTGGARQQKKKGVGKGKKNMITTEGSNASSLLDF